MTRGISPGRTGADRLLRDVPLVILKSDLIAQRGLTEGLAQAASYWRDQIAAGNLAAPCMRAAIVPVAALTSAMLEALLCGVRADLRPAVFDMLAADSRRVLTGRPHHVIIQSGIL